MGNSKKDFWRFVIQTLISILTAILTALGATSCVAHF
ncbi:MAG: smalltalk protein [Bacteroidaceae bacterium]|nr:smalltalk protein [Bacteroidaceae bacterium]